MGSEIAEFLDEKHTLNMAKFNSAYFLIAGLLFMVDQATAKKFPILIPTSLSGLLIIVLVVVAIILFMSIVYCCLKCVCDCSEDEEQQEAHAQLESVHSVQHGFYKSSNDQPLGAPLIAPPPYPPQPINNPEHVTRFGSHW